MSKISKAEIGLLAKSIAYHLLGEWLDGGGPDMELGDGTEEAKILFREVERIQLKYAQGEIRYRAAKKRRDSRGKPA